MKTIYKYPVPTGFAPFGAPFGVAIDLGGNAVVRYFGPDPQGNLCVWAEIDTDVICKTKKFHVVGTGHPLPKNASYLMSCLDKPYVWHLYAENPGG